MQIEKTFMFVITDLDGTLLDHETYSWAEASEAKEMLASRHIPLVMCSSKTVSEIQTFRASLEINYPFIVENGGAVYLPPKSDQDVDWNCIALTSFLGSCSSLWIVFQEFAPAFVHFRTPLFKVGASVFISAFLRLHRKDQKECHCKTASDSEYGFGNPLIHAVILYLWSCL